MRPTRVAAVRGLALAAAALAAANALLLWRHAVDAPFMDDWQALRPEALPAGFSPRWILAAVRPGPFAPTKLLVWLLYRTCGWNLRVEQLLTYLLYLAMLVVFARCLRALAGPAVWPAAAAFAVLLACPRGALAFSTSWMSDYHLALLFFFWAAPGLFPEDGGAVSPWALAGAWLAVFSHSLGWLAVAAALAVLLLRRGRRGWPAAATLAAALLAARPWRVAGEAGFEPVWSWPGSGAFDRFLGTLLAHGFGWHTSSILAAAACAALVAVPVVGALRKTEGARRDLLSAVAGALAAMAACAAWARASRGLQAAEPRYEDFLALLPPLTAACWLLWLGPRRGLAAAACVWAFMLLGQVSGQGWDYARFSQVEAARRGDLRCIADHYRDGADLSCLSSLRRFAADYPRVPEAEWQARFARGLEEARALNVSFYRRLASEPAPPESGSVVDLSGWPAAASFARQHFGWPDASADGRAPFVFDEPGGYRQALYEGRGLALYRGVGRARERAIRSAPAVVFVLPGAQGRLLVLEARHGGADAAAPRRVPLARVGEEPLAAGGALGLRLLSARKATLLRSRADVERAWIVAAGSARVAVDGRAFTLDAERALVLPPGRGAAVAVEPAGGRAFLAVEVSAPRPPL